MEEKEMQRKVEQIVDWLKKKKEEAGMKGLLVGVSGGIDSAVVAHLIKKASPDESLGVILPCKSDPQDNEDAIKVNESCGIESMTVDLTDAHNALFPTIQEQLKNNNRLNEEKQQLVDANLRARLRMSTLYAIAGNSDYLVVGTDNAAEFHTGYFTKYGDGGVDLVPLVSLGKGEVREMAAYLGVPDSIVNKQPSAGLWEGQTDENEMGTTYEKIDAYLRGEEIPEEDKQIIDRMHRNSAHKREIAPGPDLA